MADNTVPDQVVASPTYMADIRSYFRPEDVDHMSAKGIDLGTYDGVKRNVLAVFAHTAPPNADMPPDPAGKWSAERSQTFKNWIVNGYPLGTATPPVGTATPPDSGSSGTPPDRLRKNVTSLSAQEIQTLSTAFTGLMGRPPGDADSYFALAGNHGLPQAWCMHHEDPFNPWHRVYLKNLRGRAAVRPRLSGCDAPLLGRDDSPARTAPAASVRQLYPAAGSGGDG